MDRQKCDMCGLYLDSDGAVCEECRKHAGVIKKTINHDQIGGHDERDYFTGEPGVGFYQYEL